MGAALKIAAATMAVVATTAISARTVEAQGGAMMGRCPMCGGPMMGRPTVTIPEKLPKPKSAQWVSRLQDILSLERLSSAQYSADENKHHVMMPYRVIIPQEHDHIDLISRLFKAYGLTPGTKRPAVKKSASVAQAYRIGRDLETQLIPKYVWLVRNSEDSTSKQVLEDILLQTRMHQVMFTHALEMASMGMGH